MLSFLFPSLLRIRTTRKIPHIERARRPHARKPILAAAFTVDVAALDEANTNDLLNQTWTV